MKVTDVETWQYQYDEEEIKYNFLDRMRRQAVSDISHLEDKIYRVQDTIQFFRESISGDNPNLELEEQINDYASREMTFQHTLDKRKSDLLILEKLVEEYDKKLRKISRELSAAKFYDSN